MQAYNIKYEIKGKTFQKTVDAKDMASAKKKLGRKHGYTTGRMIKVLSVGVIGYF